MPITYPYTPVPGETIITKVSLDSLSHRVISFPTQQAQEHMIYMQYAGNYFALSDYSTIRQGLPSYMINITLGGNGILEYDGKQHQLPPRCFYWIDCMKRHVFYTSPGETQWHVLWIHLWGGNTSYYYNMFRILNGGSVTCTLSDTSTAVYVISQLMDLYQTGTQDISRDIQASVLLTSLMAECIKSTYTIASNRISQIEQYLKAHIQEKITLEQLSKEFYMSPFYIQRIFKKYTGVSPAQYVTSLRINLGKEFLLTTDKSITDIAYSVGISNVSYFSSLFKQAEGISPQAYRRLWGTL